MKKEARRRLQERAAMLVERKESSGSSSSDMSATPAASAASSTSDVSQYPVHSLPIEGCVYRGEGNANLVVALPSERKVIRLRKSACGAESSPEEEDCLRVRREVDFIRAVISGFLGCYVCEPEILHCDQAEIARLSEKIRLDRPESRRGKDVVGGYATKFPDYTFLPEHLSEFSSKPTFCVEIKPKQGFICKADRQFRKCPYCLTQYYKIHTGSTKAPSAYCPFDLFSGETERMNRALAALLHSPQNNFKIFKDGSVVYDEKVAGEESLRRIFKDWLSDEEEDPLEVFQELTRYALTRPFDVDNEERVVRAEDQIREIEFEALPPSRLEPELVQRAKKLLAKEEKECVLSGEKKSRPAKGSVLERILRMQRLHRIGADAVAWVYAKFSALLSDELIYADLVRTADASVYPEVHPEVVCVKNKQLSDGTVEDKISTSTSCEKNNNKQKSLADSRDFGKNVSIEECLAILKSYLLFCTAKDCSILMAFQEVDKELSSDINPAHRINTSKGRSFLVNVRVLDLDMKKLESVKKHRRRDNDVLKATINELEKKL
ncbi:inositol-pentakisphosphate 2-kinase isoform X2 [Nasonia vitripennis]|uniref:Inositol-pentakisphosphate 2-kinase n=2 Tax=Nasonia vitripennis TaxID=7425 RepID=A0A7M7QHI9_NASVI|nr:inositol-pentakisphosphate 2-kinase isoform X2 [Nasonia vitripennis]